MRLGSIFGESLRSEFLWSAKIMEEEESSKFSYPSVMDGIRTEWQLAAPLYPIFLQKAKFSRDFSLLY